MEQSTATGQTPVRILVVDDHPNTANTLARAISQLGPGVSVVSATSGKEALEKVQDAAADILITDMIMPDMNGLELIEKLQNHPAGRPSCSFLMTAYDVPGLQITARRLKVKDVLVKPIHPERISQLISRTIESMGQGQQAASPAEIEQAKSFKILIADDQPDNVILMSRYLRSEGYQHIEARDGLEALRKISAELPDLVLLDINMPHKDGFAVLEEMRANPETQHIPVIILTAARLDPIEVQSGLNMGADDYVTKPFDRRELMARIRTKLRVKEAEDVIRRRNRELNLLPEIGRELSARLNIDELATILLKRTVQTLGAMLGHMIIQTSAGVYQRTYRLDSHSAEIPFGLSRDLFERLIATRQGNIIDDTSREPEWQSFSASGIASAIVVPLHGRHNMLGVLVLTNEQTNYFTQEQFLLVQAITSQASIAIENAYLYEELSQEQQRLATVMQSAADAILMFDSEGHLAFINPAARKLFTDYAAKVGQRLANGAGYDVLIELLERARNSGASLSGEVVWPDRRVFSALASPVPDGGIVAFLHDVTHFKDLERVKNEFISTASHDLKNPIAVISGFCDLLAKAGPLNSTQTGFLRHIHSAALSMNELVQDLLQLAKMDMGIELKREPVDLSELLQEVKEEFQAQVETKAQTLTLEDGGRRPRVQGDRLHLKQALRNLVGNASKYTPKGGSINIAIETKADLVAVLVKDTGYGIPADDLPFIFDRFYRVHSDSAKDVEGNGLGLAIVKSIIEQHGGHIEVESNPGQGSCFSLILPCRQQESSLVQEAAHIHSGSVNGFQTSGDNEYPGFRISRERTS